MTGGKRSGKPQPPVRARLLDGFADFLQTEVAGSVVLLSATALALILANSALYPSLARFTHAEIGISIGSWAFSQSVAHWIDDGLMAVFFFVIGLEVKRELVVGELSTPRQAILPVVAALGGMVAPALIYLALNVTGPGRHGWGIPMATDIAFSLGVLAVLGSRAPSPLKLFLTTFAIADDIGAIIVIAVFYSTGLHLQWLAVAAVLLALLLVLNRLRVDSTVPYAVIGVLVWAAVLNSGIHATIAGVLVALTIPTRSKIQPRAYCDYARETLDVIEIKDRPGAHPLEDDEQQVLARELGDAALHISSPLQRMEHSLHPFSTFVVLPLFALVNAGVRVVGLDVGAMLRDPVAIGIALGLLVGKPVGITAASWLACRLRLGCLPPGLEWRHVVGAGLLGGIGFTMSLFVTNLAFPDPALAQTARLAILATSAVAGLMGWAYLRAITSRDSAAASQ